MGRTLPPDLISDLKSALAATELKEGRDAPARRLEDTISNGWPIIWARWLELTPDLDDRLAWVRRNRSRPSTFQVEKRERITRANEVRERIGEERATARARAEINTIRAVEIPAREDQARAIGQLGAIRAEKARLDGWQEAIEQGNWRQYERLEARYLKWKDRVWPVFALLMVLGWGAVIMWNVWSSESADPLTFGFPPLSLFGLPTLDVLTLFSLGALVVLVLFLATLGGFSRASARMGEAHAQYGHDAWLLNRVRSELESAELRAELSYRP